MEVRVEDVMPLLADARLAKIDIEGGEWALLQDERLKRGPAAIVLEFHPAGCPGTRTDEAAERLLAEAGYGVVPPPRPFSAGEFPPGQGLRWAVRRCLLAR